MGKGKEREPVVSWLSGGLEAPASVGRRTHRSWPFCLRNGVKN